MADTTQFIKLTDEFLSNLVTELDDDTVTAIVLHGSYARGDATPPYSDIDLVRITQETPDRKQQKRFIWRDGYLLNLSSRPLSIYQEWLTMPEEAIFRIQSIREARILLEKSSAFRTFQQEALDWKWEPLQLAANAYASQLMIEQTEIVLKILRAITLHDTVALIEMTLLDLLSSVTEALAVQRGILVKNGNSFLRQVQEAIGIESAWTQCYMGTTGIVPGGTAPISIEGRGIAALRLYQKSIQLLWPYLFAEHLETIEPLLSMIDLVLSKEII